MRPGWMRRALPLALVVACASVAAAVRAIVASDTLSDTADLALTACGFAVVLTGLVVSIRLTRAAAPWHMRIVAPLALVIVAALFLVRSFDDASVEAHGLMTGASTDGPPAVVALGPDGTDIRFSGEIHEGDAGRLEALLDSHPAVRRIHLTSEGGLVDEGEALGAVIAAHGITTYVPDYCVSACTLAFLAGHERLALRDARLGFHAPYEEGLFGQTFRGDAGTVREAYAKAGLSPAFVETALETASDDMWYPEPERLLADHVVSAFVDRAQLPDSNLDSDPTLAGARAIVLHNFRILAGLRDTEPAVVDRIADWYLAAYRHDWSEDRATEGLHALTGGVVVLAARRADDATLVGLARYAAAAMDAADDDDCRAIGAHGDLVTAASVLGENDDRATAKAATLIGSAMTGSHVAAALRRGETSTKIVFHEPRAESCAGLRRAYATALARPPSEAAALLRPRVAAWAQRSVGRLPPLIPEP